MYFKQKGSHLAPSMADQRPERKANFQAQTFGKAAPLVELKLMVEFIKRLKERLEKKPNSGLEKQ